MARTLIQDHQKQDLIELTSEVVGRLPVNHGGVPDPASQKGRLTLQSGVLVWTETIERYNETVGDVTSATIDRAAGGIQNLSLTANASLSFVINTGESLTLHLSGGDSFAVSWPSMTWIGGSAPTLSADDVIEFWKNGPVLFGAHVGSY